MDCRSDGPLEIGTLSGERCLGKAGGKGRGGAVRKLAIKGGAVGDA